MKEAIKMAAQGDVLFMRVEKIPAGYEPVKSEGPIVVAHSETGHHHTVPGLEATLYSNRADPMTSYLKFGDDVQALTVTHHRPHDTHESIRLLGGGSGGGGDPPTRTGAIWMVRRQREHTPEGWRRVED